MLTSHGALLMGLVAVAQATDLTVSLGPYMAGEDQSHKSKYSPGVYKFKRPLRATCPPSSSA